MRDVVEEGQSKRVKIDVRKRTTTQFKDGLVTVEQTSVQIRKAQETWHQLPRTKAEATASGSKHFFTGKPCRNGHIAPRFVRAAATCVQCVGEQSKKNGEALVKKATDLLKLAPYEVRNRNERTVTDRLEAARLGMLFYFDPKGCENDHDDVVRYTRSTECVQCHSAVGKRAREKVNKRMMTIDNKNILANPTTVIE